MKLLYFGAFDPSFSRNKTYIEGLRRNGVTVDVCTDQSPGLRKYIDLYKKHRQLRGSYDAIVVGFTGYHSVPFVWLVTRLWPHGRRTAIVFDALCSFYETNIISRGAFEGNPFRVPYARLVDWLATRCADIVLVETEHQKKYFIESLGVRPEKLVVTYTGVDDSTFHADGAVKKADTFTVLFRGRITKEAGATHVLQAAKLLEREGVDFLVIGYGVNDAIAEFDRVMDDLKPANVRHIRAQVPPDELRALMLSCHVSLGQLSDNERLSRTIPHKAFESLAMKLPYITARAEGISEILTDGEDCLMVRPADPADLAEKILKLRDDAALARKLADAGFTLYEKRFTPEKIVQPIIQAISFRQSI